MEPLFNIPLHQNVEIWIFRSQRRTDWDSVRIVSTSMYLTSRSSAQSIVTQFENDDLQIKRENYGINSAYEREEQEVLIKAVLADKFLTLSDIA